MNAAEAKVVHVGGDRYPVRPWLGEELADLRRWRQLDRHGRWRAAVASPASPGGIVGEWISDSPSLFFDQRIDGDYIWQVRATRLRPTETSSDGAFLQRFHACKHARGCDPLFKYNFNFWLRVDTPDAGAAEAEDFWRAYPRQLGHGWNGMGDDHWQSLFNTVVWNGPSADDPGLPAGATGVAADGSNWVRLRRSPGYVQICEAVDLVPHLPYDEPHVFSFAVGRGRVRMYFDDRRIYDYRDADGAAALPGAGYIGLCVWLCVMRFDAMRLYEWVATP